MDRRYPRQKYLRRDQFKSGQRKRREHAPRIRPRVSHRIWFAMIGMVLLVIMVATVIVCVALLCESMF
jgi:Flp pilus assembly protein TadB